MLILSILKKDPSHPNVKQIYSKTKKLLPNVSLATVYRNLNFLKKRKLITELDIAEQINRYEINKEDHDHFICNICKNIYDIKKYPLKNRYLKKNGNYDIGRFDLKYFGICYKCQDKKSCVNSKLKNIV